MDLRPAMIQDLCLSFMVAAGTLEILKGIRLWDLLRSFTPRFPLSFPMKKRGDEKLEQIKAEAWGLKPNVLGRLDTFRSRHFMFGEPTRRWKFTHVMTICEGKLYFGHGYDMITLYLLVGVMRHWTSHDMFVF